MANEKKDLIVADVRETLLKRSEFGIRKYGKTLDENLDSDFIQHAFEEAADTLLYLRTFQVQMEKYCERYSDEELGRKIRELYSKRERGVTSSPQETKDV